ncbi:MAG: response regulator [Pseudomonadota bacterium]
MIPAARAKDHLFRAVAEAAGRAGDAAPEFLLFDDPALRGAPVPEGAASAAQGDGNAVGYGASRADGDNSGASGAEAFVPLLDALLAWAITVGPRGIAGIALWRGQADFGETAQDLVIEAVRFTGGSRPVPDPGGEAAQAHAALMAAAWELGVAAPVVSEAPGIARCLLRLAGAAGPATAAPVRWGLAFERRRLLTLRDPVLSPGRVQRSLGTSTLATDFIANPAEAAAAVAGQAQHGMPYDFAVLSATMSGERVAETVAALRAAGEGSDLRIVLSGATAAHAAVAGIDRLVRREAPEQLMDVLFEVVRSPSAAAKAQAGDARIVPAGRQSRSDSGSEEAVPSLVGKQILIVEDVAMNRALLQAMLAPTGATLAMASDGGEAVRAVAARPTDLVLMDIQLPVMDGLEATRRIRAEGRDVPIVALTANAREADRATYLSASMDGYLAKPIRVDDLYAILRRVLLTDRAG